MVAGTLVLGCGVVILLLGKKPEVSYTDLFELGRRVYDLLDQLFERPNVIAFRVLAISGMLVVVASVASALWRLVPA